MMIRLLHAAVHDAVPAPPFFGQGGSYGMAPLNGELRGKMIYIAGPRPLGNAAAARCIEEETDAQCRLISFEDIASLLRVDAPPRSRMLLVDALERNLRAAMMESDNQGSGLPPSRILARLMSEDRRPAVGNESSPPEVCGIFCNCRSVDDFIGGIQSVFLKGCRSPADDAGFPSLFVNDSARAGAPALSRREFQILFLLAGGLRNHEIAARLYLSRHTVRTHLYNIFKKIGAQNRVQAAAWIESYVDYFFFLI